MRTGAGISLPFGIHIDRVVVDAETCKSGGGNLTPAWSGSVEECRSLEARRISKRSAVFRDLRPGSALNSGLRVIRQEPFR